MTRPNVRRAIATTLFALLALAFLAFLGCLGCKKNPAGGDASFTTLGASVAPLRDAFDADVGSVRVVMLVSPS